MAAAFFLSVLVADGSISTTPKFFFIYLTNLGFIIQTLHLVVSLAIPIELLLQKSNDETVGEKTKQIIKRPLSHPIWVGLIEQMASNGLFWLVFLGFYTM